MRCRSPIRSICVNALSVCRSRPFTARGCGAFWGVGFVRRDPDEELSKDREPCAQAQRRSAPFQARSASGVSAGRVAEKDDITMPELAAELAAASGHPGRSRLALALAHPQRLPLQKKRCWPASKIVPTSARRARNGRPSASRGCGLSRIGWSSSTRPEPPPR